MSGFHLVPVDGGDPVHLPPGETLLGRGSLLGVSDKRVSRHHGLLQNLDGQLRVKPIHVNPCFIQTESNDEPRPLQKDCWYPLRHGELLSLLPGRFVFRVEAVGGGRRAPSQTSEEEEPLGVPGPDAEAVPASPAESLRDQEKAGSPGNSFTKAGDGGDGAPSAHRKRVLPAWMMAADVASTTPSSTVGVQSPVKTSKRPAARPAQATPTAASSREAVENSGEEERPRKKRREGSDEEGNPPTRTAELSTGDPSELSTDTYGSKTGTSEVPDQSELEVEADRGGDASSRAPKVRKSKEEKKAPVPDPSKPVRQPCPYGKDCYRKNPLHFQDCSHPGDADYKDDEEEDEAGRPECPYGTDCYRKNPLHRKEYKHTRRAARSTRTVARGTADDDDDDDDGFINDDSEDGGDDSDYIPQASDGSDKEDVERLQREARAFVKRRK
ncbi:aprataxin and PNK-like factor isoform X2 [Cololabis saira]|uniref:aprataxin and PNK-like factor isoform X2 n=1 Tax=Cololabis saira TaxID=129043 RepID=UPI002AD3A915|nr:aprataxin and PNK-like factor isoform X2 [Cololabis saira]